MRNTNRIRQFKAVIGLAILLVFFQNCTNNVRFSEAPLSEKLANLGSNQNGDGYLGKPPPGEFIRSHIDFNCLGMGPVSGNTQGFLQADESGVTVTQDNCQDFSYFLPWSDSKVETAPYNPDFVLLNSAIYERVESFVSDPGSAVETFCRVLEPASGIDVIAKIDDQNKASVKIYSGRESNGVWSSRIVSGFAVVRRSSALTLNYSSEGFDLKVDLSNLVQMTHPGRLVAMIDGEKIEKDMTCRRMREDSAIQYSAPGLVGLWQLNGNYMDFSGLNNHGSAIDPNGLMRFEAGHYLQSVWMDGATNRIEIPASPSLNNLQQVTVTAWVWPAADVFGSTTHGGIAHKADNLRITRGWKFGIGAQTRSLFLRAAFSGGDLYINGGASPTPLVVNAWNHVAFTWDGSPNTSGVRLYINGNRAPMGAGTNGAGTRIDDTDLPLVLGEYSDAANASLEGRLDHVSIWNRQLTPAEISNLFQSGAPSN